MFELYIGNKNYSSRSLRGWLVAKLSGEAFEEIPVALAGVTPNPANLAFSPSGLVPCLHEGDIVVWDSLAIANHLAKAPSADVAGGCERTRAGALDQRRNAFRFIDIAQRHDDVHSRAR